MKTTKVSHRMAAIKITHSESDQLRQPKIHIVKIIKIANSRSDQLRRLRSYGRSDVAKT